MRINISNPLEAVTHIPATELFGLCTTRIQRKARTVIHSTFLGLELKDNPRVFLGNSSQKSLEDLRKFLLDRASLNRFLVSIDNGGRVYANIPRFSPDGFRRQMLQAYGADVSFLCQSILYNLLKPFGLVEPSYSVEERARIELPISPTQQQVTDNVISGKLADIINTAIKKAETAIVVPKRQFSLLAFEDTIAQYMQTIALDIDNLLFMRDKYDQLFTIAKMYMLHDDPVITTYGPRSKLQGMMAFMSNSTLVRLALLSEGTTYLSVRPFEINDVANEFMRLLNNMIDYEVVSDSTVPAVHYRALGSNTLFGAALGERTDRNIEVEVVAAYLQPTAQNNSVDEEVLLSNRRKAYTPNKTIRNVHLQKLAQFANKGDQFYQSRLDEYVDDIQLTMSSAIYQALRGSPCKGRFITSIFDDWYDTMIDRLLMKTNAYLVPQQALVDLINAETATISYSDGVVDEEEAYVEKPDEFEMSEEGVIQSPFKAPLNGEGASAITYNSHINRLELSHGSDKYVLVVIPNYNVMSEIRFTPFIDGAYVVSNLLLAAFSFSTEFEAPPKIKEQKKDAPLIKGKFFYGDLLTNDAVARVNRLKFRVTAPSLTGSKGNAVIVGVFGNPTMIPDSVYAYIGLGWYDLRYKLHSLQQIASEIRRGRYLTEFPGKTAKEVSLINSNIADNVSEAIYAYVEQLIVKAVLGSPYLKSLVIESLSRLYANQGMAAIDRYSAFLNNKVVGEVCVSIVLQVINLFAAQVDDKHSLSTIARGLAKRQMSIGLAVGQNIATLRDS